MQVNLGSFRSTDGRVFMAYWEKESGRVYMKMERTAFLSSFIEAGHATHEEDARRLIQEHLTTKAPSWR